MTNLTFAELLSDALDRRGISPGEAAAELARRGVKIHRGTLARWRSGESVPSVDKLDALRRLPDAIGLSTTEKAEFLRAAGAALGFPLGREGRQTVEITAIPQRIHFGAEDLPPFAGREAELAELKRLVLQRRPVMITGLAGIGKTRLAREVLRSCAGYFTHGCEFLALTPGQPGDQVLRNVAHLLGVDLAGGSFNAEGRLIAGRLRDRLPGISLLFLVDNVANPAQVRDLVHELPAVTWVFTARNVSLSRDGVHSLRLGLPSAAGATAMFHAHTQAGDGRPFAHPDGVEDLDPARVAAIVERVGRLPIAIRLVSALLANGVIASVAELEAWLDEGGLLRGGLRAGNLRRLFDQLLAGLPDDARAVFETCGIFAGRTITLTSLTGVSRRAGIAVRAGAWESLADYSLIDLPDENRIELHPLLHDYARLRLRAGPRHAAVSQAYRDYYLHHCRSVSESVSEHERNYWRLQPEEMNLLAVAESFRQDGDVARLKAMWPALSGYLWNTGNHAGYETFDRHCLAAADAMGDTDWAAILLSELGFVALERADWAAAGHLFERSQAIHDAAAGQIIEQARLRRYRAALAMRRGETDEALRLLAQCEARLSRLANPPEARLDMALVLLHSARMNAHHRRGELDRAAAAGERADVLFKAMQASGQGHRLGEFKLELGDVCFRRGDIASARAIWEEMLRQQDGLSLLIEHAEASLRLARLEAGEGRVAAALSRAQSARRVFIEYGRGERAVQAGRLLDALETGDVLPGMKDLIAGTDYPAY